MQKREPNFSIIQVAVWIVVYILMLLYSIRGQDSFVRGSILSTSSLSTCLLALYCQSHLLLPRFYQKGKRIRYLVWTVMTFIGLVGLRAGLEFLLINKILGITHFYTLGLGHLALSSLVIFLCSVIGGLLRISLDYVDLLKKQETLSHRQLATELNLLKNQVQPHFIFNTLNNIYSLAHRKSDKTAEVVAMLSEIMRYFVQEAGKEQVRLSDEINFIKNYIALENIRILRPPLVRWFQDLPCEEIFLPPMLFIPFVENVFKHGIIQDDQPVELFLSFQLFEGNLIFRSKNQYRLTNENAQNGTGLANLSKRLDILFDKNHELTIVKENGTFETMLKIPIHDANTLSDR